MRQYLDKLQWGHGREAMDGGVGPPVAYLVEAGLQWGHGREAMDGKQAGPKRDRHWALQWGHGREAMDGFLRDGFLPRQKQASMGPWP